MQAWTEFVGNMNLIILRPGQVDIAMVMDMEGNTQYLREHRALAQLIQHEGSESLLLVHSRCLMMR